MATKRGVKKVVDTPPQREVGFRSVPPGRGLITVHDPGDLVLFPFGAEGCDGAGYVVGKNQLAITLIASASIVAPIRRKLGEVFDEIQRMSTIGAEPAGPDCQNSGEGQP